MGLVVHILPLLNLPLRLLASRLLQTAVYNYYNDSLIIKQVTKFSSGFQSVIIPTIVIIPIIRKYFNTV